MRTWIEPTPLPIPEELQAAVGGHPLVAQTLVRRGISTLQAAQAFLDPGRYTPTPPASLPGLSAAADRVESAIRNGEAICVWGDFDVDGQTSTTLLVSALRDLGADVRYHIPVRANESHGVNLPWLQRIIADGARLVLTCDTGITAHEAVDCAYTQGVEFVITDHHDLPESLPAARAIVNPKLGAGPCETLPGVGVAYKLTEELYARFDRAPEIAKHLDLAALGIVADLALLRGETRYLLQRGLPALQRTERAGLRAIMELAELNPAWLTETHIAFMLGPRLNALGRLDDANLAVELLTTTDSGRARVLATQIEGLNARRQLLTGQVFQGALAQIERSPELLEQPALVLAHPAWPAGVIGIVASRLVEHFNRPTILLATPPGELARGSARSVAGCNITAAIATQKALLAGFGGHPMAAGLSIEAEKIPEFRRGLGRAVAQALGDRPEVPPLQIDGDLPLAELSLELVEDLERLAPFGAGNPPLVLASRGLRLASHAAIGRRDEHLQLIVEDEQGVSRKVLWWQGAGWELPQGRFDLAYTARASNFRGLRDVQIEWVDARPLEAATSAAPISALQVVDYRHQAHPLAILKEILAQGEARVWCEGDARARLNEQGIAGVGRDALTPAAALVIWTTPPGPAMLQAALDCVKPQTVYAFSVDPEGQTSEAYLRRLAGLVKYALRSGPGQVRLAALAAATAQSEAAVRLGLSWLAAQGHITIGEESEGEISLQAGQAAATAGAEAGEVKSHIEALLEEAAAYRRYWKGINDLATQLSVFCTRTYP